MFRINVRSLLAFSTEELWKNLEGNFTLVFDDGEIETNHKETIYSSYVWEFHKRYPKTPIKISHHVKTVLNGERLGTRTHLDLLRNVIFDEGSVFDTYNDNTEAKRLLLDDLAKLAYQVTNAMYNDLTEKLEPWVTSLDITDFINITRNPIIYEATNKMEPTQEGIDKVYSVIKDQFKNNPELKNNPVVNVINSGLANMGQALQCVGARGFLTDIDSNIFNNPIKNSFTRGIRSVHDMIIETRSAAKSLMFSENPLQQTEYFSRRQQIVCQIVKNLHIGDCGSTKYLEWHVRDARYEGTTKISDCDLETIAGKYYLDETTNQLKVVKRTDRHLIDKTIKMRSVIAGCSHNDPYGVCETCFGETALAVPPNTNLGHITCVNMTAIIGQLILSVKHYDGSSVVEGIVLDQTQKKYLAAQADGSFYYLSNNLKNYKVSLIVNSRDVQSLSDIRLVPQVEDLSISRVSEFSEIWLEINNGKMTERVPLNVFVNDRRSSFTYDILKFIKDKGWTVTEDNMVAIDMDGWDFKKPILVLPLRHVNMNDHRSEIAKMLEATVKDLEKRSSVINPCTMIIDFHDLVNRRLKINLSTLEIILYSSMGVDPLNHDYSLPKTYTTSGIGVMEFIMKDRSLAAAMGYEGHRDIFLSPSSYTHVNRPDSIFDGLIMPEIFNKV